MFKDTFIKLCNKNNVSPSFVCQKIGLSNSVFTQWTDKSVPRKATLMKIADYFNVSVDYLLGLEEKEPQSHSNESDELNEYLEEIRTRPEMKMLFSVTKNASKEDVEKAVKVIEAMLEN